MRLAFVLIHRYVGLAIAAFLFVAGLTGSVISWDREIDRWLNPQLFNATSQGEPLAPLDLAARVEASDPRGFVTYLPLHTKPGDSVSMLVDARADPATDKLFDLGYDQVFIDPVTGTILGKREWGAIGLDRQHLIPFLYKLHYSLCIPELWGIDTWGVWLMGGIALLWIVDCFVGFYLTLPMRRRAAQDSRRANWWNRWKPAWRIKWGGSGFRINFDIHRAFGLWTWILLFILAVTAASLNLYKEVAQPVVAFFSTFTLTPSDLRTPAPKNAPIMPQLSTSEILVRARAEAGRRQWQEPPGAIGYIQQIGVYSVRFFEPGDDHGAAGVGPAELYFDGEDGRYLGDRLPWHGTAGDLFLQIQFPLHSGRIAGIGGRIIISIMGLVVATLSVTGVVVWWKKYRARVSQARKQNVTISSRLAELNSGSSRMTK